MIKWTEKWPTKEGKYWFYGWTGSVDKKYNKKKLYFTETMKISNGLMFYANGQFLYKEELEGKWTEVELPTLPRE